MLSLHVPAEPKHHPVQHPWLRAVRALSPAPKREIAAHAFLSRSYLPSFLRPGPTGPLRRFEEELSAMCALPVNILCLGFTRHLGDRPDLAEEGGELAHLAEDEPYELAHRLAVLLSAYWEAGFCPEWERIEPELAETLTAAERQIAGDGVFSMLGQLWPEVRSDPSSRMFWVERVHDHDVELSQGDRLVFAPSFYVWPHVRVNYDAPWPYALIYTAPRMVWDAQPRLPPVDLLGVLRALADDTRLRTLRLITERPRSTQGLALLIGIMEAALSKRLRMLADAGIVTSRREGYYVIYHVNSDQLLPLTAGLLAYLGALRPGAERIGRE